LTEKGYCKICAFFNHAKWLSEGFQKKAAEGSSLRILKAYLEGLGCKVDLKTISSHLEHMDYQIITQRKHEKSLRKKTTDSIQKLRDFFKPQETPSPLEGCRHIQTAQFYDIACEKVFVRCSDCGAILGGGIDPEENEKRMNRDPRNVILYNALRKVENA
jgi:hypothetical protein